MSEGDRILIYAPVPLYQVGDALYQEDQACNGLRLWAENFGQVTVMSPLRHTPPPAAWQPVSTIGPNLNRIDIVPLPYAYEPLRFLREFRGTRDIIRREIDRADYLAYSIGGLFGDWGSVGCWETHKTGRPFAVWTDRVESEVIRRTGQSGSWKKRLRARIYPPPMAWLERFLIRRATVGLFHGKETFDSFAPYCRAPHVVHDIHLKKSDHIAPEPLQAKIAAAASGRLKIGYAGRDDAMKGPLDWVGVLEALHAKGVDFEAFWMGEGSHTEEMRQRIAAAGLEQKVRLLGFVRDRAEVLRRLRDIQIFLFCHKTPESPRCLIESLVSGTPVVGYDGAYARDLISGHGGGRLVALNDVAALGDAVAALETDRTALAGMIAAAASDGAPYDDETVFRHRCEVLRAHLGKGS